MSGNKKIILSLIIGLLLSGIALYVTFKNIPLLELVAYLKSVNYWWVIPSVVIALVSFLIRVVRWQLLLSPIKKTGFWRAYHPLMIGFMVNCLLPGRVGELARPAIFYKREKVSFSKVLATVGAERVFDVVMLLLFFVIVLVTVEISPTLDLTFGNYHLNKATLEAIGMMMIKLSLILIACIILVSLRQSRRLIKRTILSLPNLLFFASNSFKEKIRERLFIRLAHIIDNVGAGLALLKSPKKVGLCLGLSFLVWVVAGVSYYVMAFGCPGIEISFLEMYAVMVILCFFISLPSAPGFWGLWEAGGVFGLLIFGVPAKEAAGFTLTNHVFQMVPVIILGLISLMIMGVNVVQVACRENIEQQALGQGTRFEMKQAAYTDEVPQ
ncbi:MAG: flippase-like domain-containing protein [Deltaproteobacteria bacterium]|nr:flippase-like domain-containing protein [Deltaproteobacteria bacterium]MBW2075373.1 flippase-like domain-containing protein [Deltaproteobacteria bacterium]